MAPGSLNNFNVSAGLGHAFLVSQVIGASPEILGAESELELPEGPASQPTIEEMATEPGYKTEALAYAAAAYAVFPLCPRSKIPLGGTHAYRSATTDPEQIVKWWTKNPNANIGIAPWKSGVVVVDVDGEKGRETEQQVIGSNYPAGPWTVTTGREGGGHHHYFRIPDGDCPSYAAGGLEIKADKVHVAAPPSMHKSGRLYRWGGGAIPNIVDLPVLPEEYRLWAVNGKGHAVEREPGAPGVATALSDPRTVSYYQSQLDAIPKPKTYRGATDKEPGALEIGMALHSLWPNADDEPGFDMWCRHYEGSEEESSPSGLTRELLRAKWETFRSDRSVAITGGSLDHWAAANGWTAEVSAAARLKAAQDATEAQRQAIIEAAKQEFAKGNTDAVIDKLAELSAIESFVPIFEWEKPKYRARRQDILDFIKVDPLVMRVDGVLPGGSLYTLTAKRGAGKTGLCVNLALALAFNRGDLISKEIEPCRVLYLTAENPDMLKRRLRLSLIKFDIDPRNYPRGRLCAHGGFLTPEEMLQECQGMVEEADAGGEVFGLVVVDTLQAYFNGDDSNNNAQVVKFLQALRPITELAHKPTVLVPTHPTKYAGDDELVPYGGGGILNEIDGNLTISRKEDVVIFHHQDKLRGVPFDPIIYKSTLEMADELTDQKGRPILLPVLRRAGYDDLQAAEQKPLTAAMKILRLGEKKTLTSARAAGIEVGVGKSVAIEAVAELKKYKYFEDLPGGGFEITKAGRKYLKEHAGDTGEGDVAL
jgi:hypothetical protein